MREIGRHSSLLSCWHLIVFLNRLLLQHQVMQDLFPTHHKEPCQAGCQHIVANFTKTKHYLGYCRLFSETLKSELSILLPAFSAAIRTSHSSTLLQFIWRYFKVAEWRESIMSAFIAGKVMLLSVPSHLCYITNINNRMFMLKWFPYVEFTLVTPP